MTRAEATRALQQSTTGDRSAEECLWRAVYEELHRIAHRELAGEQPGGTLSTTALIHEAYFKLVDHAGTARRDQAHFYALACRAMRQVLVEHARERNALKRQAQRRSVTLEDDAGAAESEAEALVELDEALTRLGEFNPRLARLVELRFYGGLSAGEAAEVLELDVRTVERDWVRAKAYLYRMLEVPAT